ncbi:MAG TPA: exosortase K [Pyrinomonadaceae bacterium]|nr:exosortase K [Pyrinomonadaceae bacterium]
MTLELTSRRSAQTAVVVLAAAVVKLHYSAAGINQLRWILAPTTALVELVTGARFEFESHAGYINGERSFIIGAPCAGVNFLITAFLMLSLRRLWGERTRETPWGFIPRVALCAYVATLVANAVRISTALRLRDAPLGADWLSPSQLHRFEGIFIYFGFLLLLFTLSEKMSARGASGAEQTSGLRRRLFCLLLFYYATTLGVPLVNGAYRQGADFWEHSLFVVLTPLLLILPLVAFRFYRDTRPHGRGA